jgi:hypothetical protein
LTFCGVAAAEFAAAGWSAEAASGTTSAATAPVTARMRRTRDRKNRLVRAFLRDRFPPFSPI